jgi:glyoxylase-like metal-dependent hydrolase (beta-lactamase superfamily II)
MQKKFVLGFLLPLLLSGCASDPKRALSNRFAFNVTESDSKVGSFTSGERGFFTNTFWIEGPSGLVMIDTQFLLSLADDAIEVAEKVTGKKAALGLILHPNPDKFNGVERYNLRKIPIKSSEQVIKLIPEVHKDRHYWFYDRFKPDYPDQYSLPESFGNQTSKLSAGGVELTAHVLGRGCSENHVAVMFEGHLFVGDIVSNLNHAWLELGYIEEWIKSLESLLNLKPVFVHPGRGSSGGVELITNQIRYLKRVLELVRLEKPRKLPPKELEKVLAKVQAKIVSEYPGYGQEYFLEIGLPAVWEKAISKPKTKL